MTPYNNPRIFLANLVKFEFNKETRQYVPLVLNAKIPVVFIVGSGYYTELSNVFNNKYSTPLNLVDLNNYSKVKTYKYYITNANSLDRYTENIQEFLNNLNLNLYKINQQLGCDGNWYYKDDICLDKGLYQIPVRTANFKLDDDLYVARMVSRVKRFQNVEGFLNKDEYLHISKNYGLFSFENEEFISKLTGYEYKDLDFSDLDNAVRSFEFDKRYGLMPVYSRQELGLIDVHDIHELCSMYSLYIDPKQPILNQINSYKGLEKTINIRTKDELNKLSKIMDIEDNKLQVLNNEIMLRTLHK